MAVTFEVKGLPETKQFLKQKQKNIRDGVSQGLLKASLYMEGEVKQSVSGKKAEKKSVDTGRFLNSIVGTVRGDTGIVGTPVSYSKFLEYGTSRLAPRRHFRNSLARNKKKLQTFLEKSIKTKL